MTNNDQLEHYGVKGMKWDVRKRKKNNIDMGGVADVIMDRIVDVGMNRGRPGQIINIGRGRGNGGQRTDVIKGQIRKGQNISRRRDPDPAAKFEAIQKKTKKLIDKMLPKLSNISIRDLDNQMGYANVKRRRK